MANNPKFLKNLLTTASALALAAATGSSAMGNGLTTTGTPATLNIGGASNNGLGGFAVDDQLIMDHAVGVVNIRTNGASLIGVIVQQPGTINTDQVTAIGSIVNNGNQTDLNISAGVAVRLDGRPQVAAGNNLQLAAQNVYTGLGNITFSNAAATLNIAPVAAGEISLLGTIDGSAAGKGRITITNPGNSVIFKEVIGGAAGVRDLTLAANAKATFEKNAKFDSTIAAGGIEMGANSELTVKNGANITGVKQPGNAMLIKGAAPGNGTLIFEGASVVNGFVDGIGGGNKLAEIKIGAGKVSTDAVIVEATNISFTNNNPAAELEFIAAAVITGDIRNTSASDNVGTVTVNGANVTHNGKVGAAGAVNSIKAIKFTTDHEYKVIDTEGTIYAQEISRGDPGAARGKLGIQADTANIVTDLGGTDRKLSVVKIYQNKAAGDISTVTLKTGKTIYATEVNLAGAGRQNVLVLEADSKIDGNVVATANANNGIIQVDGNSRITGTIGAGALIGGINFNGAHTLEVGGNAISSNGAIVFGANDGTLKLAATGNTTVTAPVTVNALAAGVGTIDSGVTAGNTLTLVGNIGNVGNESALKLLKTAGGNVLLGGGAANVHIKKIDLGNAADVRITLNGGDHKLEELASTNGNTILSVGGASVLKTGTKLSTAENKLNKVDFTAAASLTLEDGVDLYTTNGFINGAAGNGSIISAGNVTLGGKIGTTSKAFGTITAQGGLANATKTLIILDDVINAGVITAKDYTTIQFKGIEIKGDQITGQVPVAANSGTVEFANAGVTKVELARDSGNYIDNVKISGAGIELTGAGVIATKNITFGNQAATITFGENVVVPVDTTNTKFVTATVAASPNQDLVFNQNVTIGNDVGTAANPFRNVILNTDNTATITNKNFFANITTSKDGKGVVDLSVADAVFQNIGASDKALKEVNFVNGATVGDTYAKDVNVSAGVIAKFKDKVAGGNVTLTGAGAQATFLDGSVLSSALKTNGNNQGIAQFEGASTIKGGIGEAGSRFAEVKFTDTSGKTQSIEGKFYSNAVNFLATKVKATGNVTFFGGVTAAGTTYNLGSSVTTFSGQTNLTGATNIVTEFDGTKIGTLQADTAAGIVNVANASSITVTLDDTTQTRVKGTKTFKLINPSTNNAPELTLKNAKLVIGKDTNKFTDWVADSAALTFTAVDQSEKVLTDSLAKNNVSDEAKANLGILLKAESGDAKAYFDEFSAMYNSSAEGEKSANESFDRLASPIATGTEAVATVVSEVASVVTERVQGLASGNTKLQTVSVGVAAGDQDNARYGIWGSPFYNQGTQKARKGVSGYNAKSFGGTFGFDTMANDTMIVGVAATVVKTDLKHKNVNSGDKTKANTMMFSVYGLQELADNWFVQGVASFGSSTIKNTAGRIGFLNGSVTKETATAKYDSMSYGGELLAGYNYKISDAAVVTPMMGLDYNRFNDGGYTETGTRNQNQIVNKKSTDKAQVVAGVRTVMAMDGGGMTINPEVHAFVRQNLGNKSPKMDIRLDGAGRLTPKSVKESKTFYNVGFGVGIQSGTMDYGVGYDLHLANKYVGHQGTLKVRVNF